MFATVVIHFLHLFLSSFISCFVTLDLSFSYLLCLNLGVPRRVVVSKHGMGFYVVLPWLSSLGTVCKILPLTCHFSGFVPSSELVTILINNIFHLSGCTFFFFFFLKWNLLVGYLVVPVFHLTISGNCFFSCSLYRPGTYNVNLFGEIPYF